MIMVIVMMAALPVQATENGGSRGSLFFVSSSVYLWKTSDTTFEAWFDVTAIDGMDALGASSITIQKSNDGTNWTSMITYTPATNPQMICNNTGVHAGCVSYIGTPGAYYRAKIVLYAKKGTSVGEMIEYTATLKL